MLVNEPFENPGLTPRFYFPGAAAGVHQLKDRAGQIISEHASSDARLELADVPFVRLRKLFPQQIGKFPGRFNALVHEYEGKIEQLSGPPKVRLVQDRPAIIVNDIPVETSAREYALYAFLLERRRKNSPTDVAQKDCVDELKAFLPRWSRDFSDFSFQRRIADEWTSPIEDDLRRLFHSLRTKFRDAELTPWIGDLLPMRRRFGIQVIC